MMVDAWDARVLEPLIAVVREELADRDPDEIPNRLRRAAAATGKALPPPHVRAVIEQVRSDDEFRAAVHERWVSAGVDAPIVDAFLADPVAAEPLLVSEGLRLELSEVTSELTALRTERDEIRAKLDEARARNRRADEEARRQRKEQRDADRRARKGLEESAARARDERDRAIEARESAERDMADAQRMVTDLESRLSKATARTKRRVGSPPVDRPSTDGGRLDLPSDPSALADLLDRVERNLRTYRAPDRTREAGTVSISPFVFPRGIRPDTPEAIDHVLELTPRLVLIDGHNLAGRIPGVDFWSRDARQAAVARADMLARATDARITIVFDAEGNEEPASSETTTDDGVRIVYSADASADDSIVGMVSDEAGRAVVITSDRELQDRVGEEGCIALFAEALVSWAEHLND